MTEKNPPRYPFVLFRDGKPINIPTTPPGKIAAFRTKAAAERAREQHHPAAITSRSELQPDYHVHEEYEK